MPAQTLSLQFTHTVPRKETMVYCGPKGSKRSFLPNTRGFVHLEYVFSPPNYLKILHLECVRSCCCTSIVLELDEIYSWWFVMSFLFLSVHFSSLLVICAHVSSSLSSFRIYFTCFFFMSSLPPWFPHISLHISSFPTVLMVSRLSRPLSLFISLHVHPFLLISLHFRSFLFISTHWSSLAFISGRFNSVFVFMCMYEFPFLSSHARSFMFLSLRLRSFHFISSHLVLKCLHSCHLRSFHDNYFKFKSRDSKLHSFLVISLQDPICFCSISFVFISLPRDLIAFLLVVFWGQTITWNACPNPLTSIYACPEKKLPNTRGFVRLERVFSPQNYLKMLHLECVRSCCCTSIVLELDEIYVWLFILAHFSSLLVISAHVSSSLFVLYLF